MTPSIEKTLKDRFGFDRFLDGQRDVVERIVGGQSAAAVFPTGAGKSLCYQLPALILPGLTLVVSPLLALMKDQLEFLVAKKIPAAKLDSSMSPADYQAALQAAKNGSVKMLMISVERFKNERFRNQLTRMKIGLMVVDEAHCISEWGHNFRPDYLKLPAYRRQYRIRQVLLLTATATPRVLGDMCQRFAIPKENAFVGGVYRSNLELRVVSAPEAEKRRLLVDALGTSPAGPAIVYVTLQKTAEKVAESLAAAGFDAEAYHAGMKMAQREDIQNRFMSGRLNVVVATIAFGMGIDKRDIRKVVHYDLPKSIENYSQEIGRAGRDGAASLCTLLGSRASLPVLENFVYGDTPEMDGIRLVLERVRQAQGDELEVRLQELSTESDIRPLPLKTLLVYLEMEKIIVPKRVYFENYPFKLVRSREEIVAEFAGERKAFVESIFSHCKTARIWTTPDIEAIVAQTGATRPRVLAALDYFNENGWIELVPKNAVEVFEILDSGFDPERRAAALLRLFQEREALDIGRLRQMVGLFESPSCLAAALAAYFGQKLAAPCGRCSVCRSGTAAHLAPAAQPPLDAAGIAPAIDQLAEALENRLSVHRATRFLCGIGTPWLIRAKATRLRGYGQLEGTPYRKVAEIVSRHLAQPD